MVCTTAFGMGVDVPNVDVVVKIGCPQSLEELVQEFGRAGRDGREALLILFTTGPVKLGSLLRIRIIFPVVEELSDKHITGCNKILQHQFPGMPSPQSCLLSQKPEQLEPAEENSVFFHHYNQHWAVSQLRDDTVYLYDSMQPKVIHLSTAS